MRAAELPEGLLDLLADETRRATTRIQEDRERATTTRVQSMLDHIAGHLLSANLNIESLKEALGIRDNSAAIDFHRQIGTPPSQYIRDQRLLVATRLLETTELRIWRIAELVGYKTINVFSRAFFRWTGVRPGAYRKRTRRGVAISNRFHLHRAIQGRATENEAQYVLEALLVLYPECLRPEPLCARFMS